MSKLYVTGVSVEQFIDQLLLEGGYPVSLVNQALYLGWLQEGLQLFINKLELQSGWTLYETITTVSGTRTYALSSYYSFLQMLQDTTSDRPLTEEDRYTLNNNWGDITETGQPRYWYHEEFRPNSSNQIDWTVVSSTTLPSDQVWSPTTVIGLFPVPDGVYSIEVQGELAPGNVSLHHPLPLPPGLIPAMKDYLRYCALNADESLGGQLAAVSVEKSILYERRWTERIKEFRRKQLSGNRRIEMHYADLPRQHLPTGPRLPDEFPV